MAITGLSKVRLSKKIWPKVRADYICLVCCIAAVANQTYYMPESCIRQRLDGFSGGDLWWCKKLCFKLEIFCCFLHSSVSRQTCPERPIHSVWTDYTSCFFLTRVRSSDLGKAEYMNRANTELQFLALQCRGVFWVPSLFVVGWGFLSSVLMDLLSYF